MNALPGYHPLSDYLAELQFRLESPDFALNRVHPVHTRYGIIAAFADRTNDNVSLTTAEFDSESVATVQVVRNIVDRKYLMKPQFAECSLKELEALEEDSELQVEMDTQHNIRKIGVALGRIIDASRVRDPLHPPTTYIPDQPKLMDPGPDALVRELFKQRVRMTPAFYEAVRIQSDIYK